MSATRWQTGAVKASEGSSDADAVPQKPEQSQLRSKTASAQVAQPVRTKGNWIKPWQTIVGAFIAAVATIVAALITLANPGTGNNNQPAQVQVSEVTMSSVHVSTAPDGGRIITVNGKVRPPGVKIGYIYAVVQPVSGQTLRGGNWYASSPAVIDASGSWATDIYVGPDEKRDFTVNSGVFPDPHPCPPGHNCDPLRNDPVSRKTFTVKSGVFDSPPCPPGRNCDPSGNDPASRQVLESQGVAAARYQTAMEIINNIR